MRDFGYFKETELLKKKFELFKDYGILKLYYGLYCGVDIIAWG